MMVGFAGTRDAMTLKQKATLVRLLREMAPDGFHHGCCVGSDFQAHHAALALNIPVHLHPADHPLRASCEGYATCAAPKPPLERDDDIVAVIDVLIATPRTDQAELRSGTWATIRRARRASKMVIIIRRDGTIA